jgi:hypothetical protein
MRALLSWELFDAAHGWQAETSVAEGQAITALLGPETPAPAPFAEAVPSWVARTPPRSWIELRLRARVDGRWTAFYRIAQWDSLVENSARRSFGTQRDEAGYVATDTLVLSGAADAIQPAILLYTRGAARPEVLALRVVLSAPSPRAAGAHSFAPRELALPARSQMAYPDGRNLCSPTAVAMVLAYWQARTGDARLAPFAERGAVAELAAPLVFDPVYDGHGNWGFNTAFAASYGLDAYVARMEGLEQIEPWVAAGVPVVISVAWKVGELDGAPIAASAGHLLVVAGFDGAGGVIVAEPRAERENEVRRLYDAAQLEAAWQRNSAGTAYLIYPRGWPVPSLAS